MRVLYIFLLICCGCQINQKTTSKVISDNIWEYQAEKNTLDMHGNTCGIQLIALPNQHELSYIVSYKGTGFLEPIRLSTTDNRLSAVLLEDRIWIEQDTIIHQTVHPSNNSPNYIKTDEKGPLRLLYVINYYEEGQAQHLRYQLSNDSYKKYLRENPYVSFKKSYQLSIKNKEQETSINQYLNNILDKKRGKGLSGVRFSENEMNAAGLIAKLNCIYDGENLLLEIKWMNHTELDLWHVSPSQFIMIDENEVVVEWQDQKEKMPFRKSKRVISKTKIKFDSAPSKINIPINNILFFDGQAYFPEGTELELGGDLII
ncbi:hypothetical protein KMW28_20505 [Flammeovirga yaeyamensis]|uniref:Lipoprotein n=1 Tax=Flammeovirga yaeyamensis TaxID=367791 RepID=A0AAX1N3C4_9BACT|nr:hypothetical protein [Flammeovirga yaeyamensis]MBB3700555.1 hypothetical protein [Flammeovirga yaeyamensis]NMF37672.1 hypothetical protein [Flammeovirga yaeyamensis]QWG01981.1 hypothetical protein KMW28_20505 [Flammeovirga yaeyamensis]